jgi:hypothetical protein
MGAHSTYTAQVADAIIEWIADGKPLREFCRQENSPSWSTVYNWLDASEEFAARFARAREIGADAIAQEALDIANTPVEGVTREIDKDGAEKAKYEDMLGHRRLQVDTRLKLLAKWFPQKYGEKTEHTLRGGVVILKPDVDDADLG